MKNKTKSKTKQTKPTKSQNKSKQFLIKKEEQYFLVSEQLVQNMLPEELYRTAMIAHIDQKKFLLREAYQKILNIPSQETIQVPEALEESLSKFEELFPSIRETHSSMGKMSKC